MYWVVCSLEPDLTTIILARYSSLEDRA
jgi:hypothetical protein